MNRKTLLRTIGIFLAIAMSFYLFPKIGSKFMPESGGEVVEEVSQDSSDKGINYGNLVADVKNHMVTKVVVDMGVAFVTMKDGTKYEVTIPMGGAQLIHLVAEDSTIELVIAEPASAWGGILMSILPIGIFIGFLYWLHVKNNPAKKNGKNNAKMINPDDIEVSFNDVAGIDEAVEEVAEVVDFLKDPSKFAVYGADLPKGVLLSGQPGTGKTMLAKAVAKEAGVPFFSTAGSEFVEMFVGVGSSRVRDLFKEAKENAPCIIFIDEIDAIGGQRSGQGGNDEREQTLNQLLVEMDGFGTDTGIILIAATNRPQILDSALMRPGRFDRQVEVPLPDVSGREKILGVHSRKVLSSVDVSLRDIARGTTGFSGADLKSVANEAALFAARENADEVTMAHFEMGKDKVMMGAERKSMSMKDSERKSIAYHESGHAIVGHVLENHDDIYKVTIVPRGRALGVAMFLPEEDTTSINKGQLEAQICSLFGGRIAEEMIYGADGVSTGASNDIERATSIATDMVTKWGFSEKLGNRLYAEDGGAVFAKSQAGGQGEKRVSGEKLKLIDSEVDAILSKCYNAARDILEDNVDTLHKITEELMDKETITNKDLDRLLGRD